jgi:glycosyltransferase involved in cell wall biosynthesis
LQPKVAVIIPCYNYGKFVEEAVQSALNQDIKIELIVVDDGSTDPGTLDILKRLRKAGIFILRQPNGGLPKARNAGIKVTSGKYIVCLDADDLIKQSYCSSCLSVMKARPEVGFVYPTTRVFGNENKLWSNMKFSCLHLLVDNYIPCAAMFRRKVWEEVGGFAEGLKDGYEDWDFWLAAVEKGWRGYHIPEALYWYRKHGQSMLSSSNLQRKELKKILRQKHRSLYSPHRIFSMIRKEYFFLPRVARAWVKETLFRPVHLRMTNKSVGLHRYL